MKHLLSGKLIIFLADLRKFYENCMQLCIKNEDSRWTNNDCTHLSNALKQLSYSNHLEQTIFSVIVSDQLIEELIFITIVLYVLCDSCRVFEFYRVRRRRFIWGNSQCECAVGLGSAVGVPVHYDFVFLKKFLTQGFTKFGT